MRVATKKEYNGQLYRVIFGNGVYHMQARVGNRYETMQTFYNERAATEHLDKHIDWRKNSTKEGN